MNTPAIPESRIAVVSFLNPKLRPIAINIHHDLVALYEAKKLQFRFEIFETLRLPGRQAQLLAEGTSKSGPWQSAHQYGLAVDFVPYLTASEARDVTRAGSSPLPGWHWPKREWEGWDILTDVAQRHGVDTPISWDGPHVEHPLFTHKLKDLLK